MEPLRYVRSRFLAECIRRCDRIDKVEVDSSRAVMIPDDSIPIVEDGKIVGHRVEAKKKKVES